MNLNGKRVVVTGGIKWQDPAALDKRFSDLKPALSQAVRDHSAL